MISTSEVAEDEERMFTQSELDQIEEYVLRKLPKVLKQDPDFTVFIEGIVSEMFPKRDEFARLLDEFTQYRSNRDKENESLHKDIQNVKTELSTEIRSLRTEMHEGFEKVDKRFGNVDKHLETVDNHLETVDKRFDQVDKRFDQVDERFEQVDKRFEKVDERFEQVDSRLAGMSQDIKNVGQEIKNVSQDMKNLRDWVELIGGRLQTRAGRNLENVVAGALRLGLEKPDIEPEQIQLRQKITDTDGVVFKPGKQKEVDILVQNGQLIVFEVKSAPDAEDVDDFADKVKVVRHQNPDKTVEGVFIALGVDEDVRRQCQKHQIRLIP
jgi:archaellum component FlaC